MFRGFRICCILFGLSSIAAAPARGAGPAGDVFVAPSGDDAAAGTWEAPVETLERALALAKEHMETSEGDVTVVLRGGRYYRDAAFEIGPEDCPPAGRRLIFRNAPGERPVVVGGRRITGWERVEDGLYRAKTDPSWKFYQVFENGERALDAQHPNEGYLIARAGVVLKDKDGNTRKDGLGRTMTSNTQFHVFLDDLPGAGGDLRGARVFVWAGYDWFTSEQPVRSIDTETGLVTLEAPTLNPIVIRGQRRYRFRGLRSALDAKGEFWRDPDTGDVYYRPRRLPVEEQEIVAPTAPTVLAMRGMSHRRRTRGIAFQGVDVTISAFADSFVETRGTHGRGPWNEPLNKYAAVYFEHADDCAYLEGEISNAGYSGAAVAWSGTGNRVERCRIRDCGFHGVLLSGYRAEFGPEMDVNRDNVVADNWIHHCGRLVGHGGGVFIHSSGHNRISNNTVHNMPRYGLCIKGQHFLRHRDSSVIKSQNPEQPEEKWTVTAANHWDFVHSGHNEVVHNDFFLCNQDSEDSGFVSVWGPGKGNLVAHNMIHDSYRELEGLGQAIYLDDEAHYFTVRGNLIYNFFGGDRMRLLFMKGTNHVIEENIIVGDKIGTVGIFGMSFRGSTYDRITIRRNVVALNQPGMLMQFNVKNEQHNIDWAPETLTECDGNLYHPGAGPFVIGVNGSNHSLEEWRKVFDGKFGRHSRQADPQFTNPEDDRYGFRPGSPALEMGIPPFDRGKAGVTGAFPERWRADLEAARAIPEETRKLAEQTVVGPSFREDFESYQPRRRPSRGRVIASALTPTRMQVVDDMASGGKKSLLVIDADGDPGFEPRLIYQPTVAQGDFRYFFDVRLDPENAAAMNVDIRDMASHAPFANGPTVSILSGGEVRVGKETVGRITPGRWARFEMSATLGKKDDRRWRLSFGEVGEKPTVWQGPYDDQAFRLVNWIVTYFPGSDGRTWVDNVGWESPAPF